MRLVVVLICLQLWDVQINSVAANNSNNDNNNNNNNNAGLKDWYLKVSDFKRDCRSSVTTTTTDGDGDKSTIVREADCEEDGAIYNYDIKVIATIIIIIAMVTTTANAATSIRISATMKTATTSSFIVHNSTIPFFLLANR